MTPRRAAACEQCGEVKDLATKEECFACYRARKRSEDAPPIVDRHNAGLRKEHQKIVSGFGKLMSGLIDLRVSRPDVKRIRRLIGPYVAPVQWVLDGREHGDKSVQVHQLLAGRDDDADDDHDVQERAE